MSSVLCEIYSFCPRNSSTWFETTNTLRLKTTSVAAERRPIISLPPTYDWVTTIGFWIPTILYIWQVVLWVPSSTLLPELTISNPLVNPQKSFITATRINRKNRPCLPETRTFYRPPEDKLTSQTTAETRNIMPVDMSQSPITFSAQEEQAVSASKLVGEHQILLWLCICIGKSWWLGLEHWLMGVWSE